MLPFAGLGVTFLRGMALFMGWFRGLSRPVFLSGVSHFLSGLDWLLLRGDDPSVLDHRAACSCGLVPARRCAGEATTVCPRPYGDRIFRRRSTGVLISDC